MDARINCEGISKAAFPMLFQPELKPLELCLCMQNKRVSCPTPRWGFIAAENRCVNGQGSQGMNEQEEFLPHKKVRVQSK